MLLHRVIRIAGIVSEFDTGVSVTVGIQISTCEKNSETEMASARVAIGVKPSSAGVIAAADDTRKGVQSVDQAFALLRVLEEANRALVVKEISE